MSFQAFWGRYLNAHAKPATRTLHVIGTLSATTLLILACVLRDWRLGIAALVAGYAPAWGAHFFIEKNRPETFKAPLRSLAADYVMTWHALAGTLEDQLATHLAPPARK